ncbi:MAG: hypothetical protein MJZ37_04770 [Bacilli bacterium]|nr:hypothetical protein [Bacilli bacterium]
MNNELISWGRKGEYQKDNFDNFLRHVKFNFNIPAVHVAGTNGKGSTVHFLEMAFKDAGYKVGSFSSPYFKDINELIKVDNVAISDENFRKIYKEYEKQFKKYDLSEFEMETFIGFMYFIESKCDICFIECGMGGELDATNIFTPVLSVITSVSLEHTAYLGKTVAEIAYSKAGIIKDDVPVVVGKLVDEAKQAIVNSANSHRTKVYTIVEPANLIETKEGYNFSYETYKDISINNLARYMVDNACIALECINFLKDNFNITNENIQHGFASKTLDARLSVLEKDDHVIIDGAHNPEGCQKLASTINMRYPMARFHIVFTSFRDKNLERMLAHLGEVTNDIVLTNFPHDRCRTEDDYFLFLGEYTYNGDPVEAVKKFREEYPDDYVLVTGSLAFASYMLEKMR